MVSVSVIAGFGNDLAVKLSAGGMAGGTLRHAGADCELRCNRPANQTRARKIMSDRPTDTVVVATAHTPFGRFQGALKNIDGPHLGALAIDETLARSKLAPADINAFYGGIGMIGSAVLTPV
jgi:hypothetical protein